MHGVQNNRQLNPSAVVNHLMTCSLKMVEEEKESGQATVYNAEVEIQSRCNESF